MKLLLLFLVGCTPKPDDAAPPQDDFPPGFLWGTATAGFQVDMGCPTLSDDECIDDASDWYAWVTDPTIIDDRHLYVTGEDVRAGPGMWETFEDDAELMAKNNLNAYRMSIEWSRLFPDDAEGATTIEELASYAEPAAIARYHEMVLALEQGGIDPLVTLNHYTMPLWVHDGPGCHKDTQCTANGWVDGDRITRLIGLYAGFVAKEFGADVDRWATLNEPFATALSGYAFPGEDRCSPPGYSTNWDATVAVVFHQIEGHAVMYDAVKANDDADADADGTNASVGIVMNMTAIHPADPEKDLDVQGAEHLDYLYHQLFLDALTVGAWDDDLDGVAETTRTELANRLDFLGINYYNRLNVLGFSTAIVPEIPIMDFYMEITWDPYPEGLGEVIARAGEYNLPLYLTENGTPHVEEHGVEILNGHLTAMASAIEDGADVRGYYYWSFVDNYEWNHGLDMRFGLFELDGTTKERLPRDVLHAYAAIAASNRLDQR